MRNSDPVWNVSAVGIGCRHYSVGIMSRTFLITGATQGIGLALAKRLVSRGFQVVGIARHAPKEDFVGSLFLADLADNTASNAVLKDINERFAIDGIVNNVGVAIAGNIKAITSADFAHMINLNLFSAIRTTQVFIDRMIERRCGRIVNVASRAILGLEGRSVYAASKAGLVTFTRSAALELAKTGVTVNAVAPGPIETEMYSIAAQKGLNAVPMGRIGKPEEVAAGIEFLLSEESSFITGQTLFVDGGASIGFNKTD